MKINKKASFKKPLLATLAVVLIAAVGAGAYFFLNRPTSGDTINADPAPARLNDEEAAAKQEFVEKYDKQSDQAPELNPRVELTATNKDGTVTITTKLYDFSDGSCELSIRNTDKTYTDTAQIIYQPEHSTCAGFSLPVSELGSGTWQVDVNATSSDVKAMGGTTLEVE